jgi:hypothetical protein
MQQPIVYSTNQNNYTQPTGKGKRKWRRIGGYLGWDTELLVNSLSLFHAILASVGTPISARSQMTATVDSTNNKVWIVGGRDPFPFGQVTWRKSIGQDQDQSANWYPLHAIIGWRYQDSQRHILLPVQR